VIDPSAARLKSEGPARKHWGLVACGGRDPRSGGAWGLFRRRAAPRRNVAPSGGSDPRSGGAWGPVSPPGRPKAKCSPLGGQRPAQRWSVGACFAAGPPQGEMRPPRGAETRAAVERGGLFRRRAAPRRNAAPSGGSDPRSGGAWGPISLYVPDSACAKTRHQCTVQSAPWRPRSTRKPLGCEAMACIQSSCRRSR
jgi:hypothetical protein